jgi:hypothetical protein
MIKKSEGSKLKRQILHLVRVGVIEESGSHVKNSN